MTAATEQKNGNYHFYDLSSFFPSLLLAFHHGGFVLRDWPSAKNPFMAFPNRPYVAVFSRAVFQVAQRVTSGSPVKTVVFSTRLKLSESANFNGILIKFKPLNQVAFELVINFGQLGVVCGY